MIRFHRRQTDHCVEAIDNTFWKVVIFSAKTSYEHIVVKDRLSQVSEQENKLALIMDIGDY